MKRILASNARKTAAVLMGMAVLFSAAASAADLSGLRAARREALKNSDTQQHFTLLVVPVDFADQRFDEDWDPRTLSAVLSGEGETFESYYRIASSGRMDLRTLLAPVVHLTGDRSDYSDLYYNGTTRTRALARESILGASAWLPLRMADGDGPDGLSGTSDDDGEVDGVLILHAAPGLENDPVDGRIVPLQYWLDDPVVDDGVVARLYAVASIHSGLGVWLHEATHLLGLEDRYDLSLGPAEGAAAAADFGRGGLGRFSLMASGHQGRGDGSGASLLDAYSAAQLGWIDPITLGGESSGLESLGANPAEATAWRVAVPGSDEREYFLIESRGTSSEHPFDAAVPAGKLLVYHVDEDVPDDTLSGGAAPHLRVRLVEADGGDDIARGESEGDAADLFPSTPDADVWGPATSPSTAGYTTATGALFSGMTGHGSGVALNWSVPLGAVAIRPVFYLAEGDTLLEVRVDVGTLAPDSLRLDMISAWSSGSFADGESTSQLLTPAGTPGAWATTQPLRWIPAPGEAGQHSRLVFELDDGAALTAELLWSYRWLDDDLFAFDDDAAWGTEWTWGELGSQTTSWSRWPGGEGDVFGSTILACTRSDATAADWPALSYDNNVDSWLLSPLFRPRGGGVRLIHHFDLVPDSPGVGPDAAVVEAILGDGTIVPLAPVDGYPGFVPSAGVTSVAGRDAFVDQGDLAADGGPLWSVDVFDLSSFPDEDLRLRFRLVSDPAWRGRGWFLHSLTRTDDLSTQRPSLDEDAGLWRFPAWMVAQQTSGSSAVVQHRRTVEDPWVSSPVAPRDGAVFPVSDIDDDLAVPGRHQLRFLISLFGEASRVALRPAARLLAGQGDLDTAFAQPWPNPSHGELSIAVRVPQKATSAELAVFDLRGRRLRRWTLSPGSRVLAWDARDDAGQRLAAGRYILRLETSGSLHTRSITLLP